MFDSRLLFRVFSAISLSRLHVSCVRGGSGTSARRFHFGAVFCALVCALVLAGATAPAAWGQATIYVDHAATGANDGSSWADAYTSLQDALDAASGSNEIYIAQGTYYPDEGQTVTDDDRSASFTITGTQDGLKVYDGFEAGDAFADRSPADHPVLLSGDIDQDNASAGNSYHVVVMDGGDGIGEHRRQHHQCDRAEWRDHHGGKCQRRLRTKRQRRRAVLRREGQRQRVQPNAYPRGV